MKKLKLYFFCVGDNVQNYPDLVQQLKDEGHSFGNHTFNHKILKNISDKEKQSQISIG